MPNPKAAKKLPRKTRGVFTYYPDDRPDTYKEYSIKERRKTVSTKVKKKVAKKFRKLKGYYLKYRSAKTGRFVTKEYALKHLKTTVSEKVYL